jgi:hypothetical protein
MMWLMGRSVSCVRGSTGLTVLFVVLTGCAAEEDQGTGSSGGKPGSGGSGQSGGNGSGGGSKASGGTSGSGASGGSTAGSGGRSAGGGGSSDASGGTGDRGGGGSTSGTGGSMMNPPTDPEDGPPAGYPDGDCAVPAEAMPEDVSNPDSVVGDGTPASCTGEAVIEAVAQGGVITFDCGPDPVTITLESPAKVFNDANDRVVLDGGGLVTLSGGGRTRILYMNTCDENQVWTTPMCDNQPYPELTVQNITFSDGNSKGESEYDGGGAIWARGGRFKAVNTRFFNNVCADTGPDVGGAAIRVFSQYEGLPVYVVNSTFGGAEGFGNTCSNGGGISSIGVSWSIINSVFSHNNAIGNGGNPAEAGTPGGGSGGAIYNDGNTMTLSICGSLIEENTVIQHGSAIFFVSNDHTGDITLKDSVIRNNTGGSWYPTRPQISGHEDTPIDVDNVTFE